MNTLRDIAGFILRTTERIPLGWAVVAAAGLAEFRENTAATNVDAMFWEDGHRPLWVFWRDFPITVTVEPGGRPGYPYLLTVRDDDGFVISTAQASDREQAMRFVEFTFDRATEVGGMPDGTEAVRRLGEALAHAETWMKLLAHRVAAIEQGGPADEYWRGTTAWGKEQFARLDVEQIMAIAATYDVAATEAALVAIELRELAAK